MPERPKRQAPESVKTAAVWNAEGLSARRAAFNSPAAAPAGGPPAKRPWPLRRNALGLSLGALARLFKLSPPARIEAGQGLRGKNMRKA